MINSRTFRLAAALLLSFSLAVAGCTPKALDAPASPLPPAGWPAELDSLAFIWTAEPGIDLTTDGAAIASRAYVESIYLANLTEDLKYLYPGFNDAVEPNQAPGGGRRGTSELHPKLGTSGPDVWAGTARHHLLSIDRSDGDVTVVACAYLYGTGWKRPDGMGFEPNIGPESNRVQGIFPLRIGLNAPADVQPKSPVQRGPSKAPYDDVFGQWKVTSFLYDYFTLPTQWPEKDSDLAACVAKAPDPPERRQFRQGQTLPLSDFPTLPATPGWPAKPAS